MYQCVKTEEER